MNGNNIAQEITNNLAVIHHRIRNACLGSGRDEHHVSLLLATKTVSSEYIKIAISTGESLIGENKIQELKEKNEIISELGIERHFIGHLQSNKIKEVLKYVTCIQSIDNFKLAQSLDERLLREGKKLDIMVQVNTSREESKFGIEPEKAIQFVKSLSEFKSLRITGLMTIGLFDTLAEKVRPSFKLLKNIKDEVISEGILDPEEFKHLSMGMSGDLETAIEEGSTIVRVGTGIFGKRKYPDSYYWKEEDK